MIIEAVFEAAWSVCDSLGLEKEVGDSVARQVKLALGSIPQGMFTCLLF